MKVITDYQEKIITFEVKFEVKDFYIQEDKVFEHLNKWSKMLSKSISVLGNRCYPLYRGNIKLFYLFGYSKWLDSREFNTTYFGYIQELYNEAKEKYNEI